MDPTTIEKYGKTIIYFNVLFKDLSKMFFELKMVKVLND